MKHAHTAKSFQKDLRQIFESLTANDKGKNKTVTGYITSKVDSSCASSRSRTIPSTASMTTETGSWTKGSSC